MLLLAGHNVNVQVCICRNIYIFSDVVRSSLLVASVHVSYTVSSLPDLLHVVSIVGLKYHLCVCMMNV